MDEQKQIGIDKVTQAIDRVATTAERVGIPATTFALGAVAIIVRGFYPAPDILTWLGTGLVLSALLTYVWMHARSTVQVHSPPPPIPPELNDQLKWMRDQLEKSATWNREPLARDPDE